MEPCKRVPYCTSDCIAKSSGELMGVTIRSTVRNAAKLAVYELIRIKVKNHQTAPTMRPDKERGDISHPCCINAANENQNEFNILKSLMAVGMTPFPLTTVPEAKDGCPPTESNDVGGALDDPPIVVVVVVVVRLLMGAFNEVTPTPTPTPPTPDECPVPLAS